MSWIRYIARVQLVIVWAARLVRGTSVRSAAWCRSALCWTGKDSDMGCGRLAAPLLCSCFARVLVATWLGSPGCETPRSSRDHCVEKLITTKNSSLLSELVRLWGLCILHPWKWVASSLKAVSFVVALRVMCSMKRHPLCWAPDGARHWSHELRLGHGKPAVPGPAVCLGNTFPSYSLGWNLILENASLKLFESLLGPVSTDCCRKR